MSFMERLRQVLVDYDASNKAAGVTSNDDAVFKKALNFVWAVEGGYVNDPYDPGGQTKYGISQRAYPNINIADLSQADAEEIYRRDYWAKSGAKVSDISETLAVMLFDTAVNMGAGTAIQLLQKALHVKEDGVFGPVTKVALENSDIEETIQWFLSNRMLRYTELPTWGRYRRGWTKRLIGLARWH